MRETSASSAILPFVLVEFKAALGADGGFSSQVLTAFRTGERKLCSAVGASLVFGAQRTAAIRTQVHAARWAFLVLSADRLPAVAAIGGAATLLFVTAIRFGYIVLELFIQLRSTVGADRGLGRDLLVALGAVETKLGSAVGADGFLGIHVCAALGARHHLRVIEFGAAVRTYRGVGGDLLAAFGAVKGKLCAALRADSSVRFQFCATIGAQVIHLIVCFFSQMPIHRCIGHYAILVSAFIAFDRLRRKKGCPGGQPRWFRSQDLIRA